MGESVRGRHTRWNAMRAWLRFHALRGGPLPAGELRACVRVHPRNAGASAPVRFPLLGQNIRASCLNKNAKTRALPRPRAACRLG